MTPSARARAWKTLALGLIGCAVGLVLLVGGCGLYLAHELDQGPSGATGAALTGPSLDAGDDALDFPDELDSGDGLRGGGGRFSSGGR